MDSASGAADLLQEFRSAYPTLAPNAVEAPIRVRSEKEHGEAMGEVLGMLDQPFPEVVRILSEPASLCDIILLHLNTKACTWRDDDGEEQVTIYSGRKSYEPPEDARKLECRLQAETTRDFLHVVLYGDKGPMGTKHFKIQIDATPLSGNRTVLRFRYQYGYGFAAKMALRAYLHSRGRGKQGFSTVEENGKTVPVKGIRGMVERNSVRYFYAVQAYLQTMQRNPKSPWIAAAGRWYNLTARHPQLYEVPRAEYLSDKRRERENSLRLERQINETK